MTAGAGTGDVTGLVLGACEGDDDEDGAVAGAGAGAGAEPCGGAAEGGV